MVDCKPAALVVWQTYAPYMSEEHVIRGNAATLRCHIPSFVADLVDVDHWLVDDVVLRSSDDVASTGSR